jgi:multidrug efflux pump subunit AcrA (membrane-fusion protein)
MASFTQQALRILEEEKQAAQVEEQKRIAAAEAEAAAKAHAERSVRVQLQAERELARIAAERALAEEQALAQRAADARALQAELARLRARSEIDVLRDEVAQMRAEQMAVLKACHLAHLPLQEIPLHAFGELDISVKSSKAELATARGEIAELKGLVHALIMERAPGFWHVGSSAVSDDATAAIAEYVRLTNPQRWSDRQPHKHQSGRENMRLD